MYCFYAAHKSERPSGKNSDANWYLKVNFELLNIKITRITKLNVETQYKVRSNSNGGYKLGKMPQSKSVTTINKWQFNWKAQPSRFLQQNKTPE